MEAQKLTIRDTVSATSQVVSRDLNGEAILLDLDSGLYFGLDEVGSRVWQWILENGHLEAVHIRMLEEFEVSGQEAESDLLRLVNELHEHGLVEIV